MQKKSAILCLDDDELILETLEFQLQKFFGDKFLYEFALDPAEAMEILDQLKREHIKLFLVISDWVMPEMYGDKFLEYVGKAYPKAQKIMITGKANKDAPTMEALDLAGFIYKPWDEKTLHKAIENALSYYSEG